MSHPRDRLVKRANPDDPSKVVHNCPFCGSGGVTGGSDGSIMCGFCDHTFKVFVQPKFLGAPSNIGGQPVEQGQRPDQPASLEVGEDDPMGPGIEAYRTARRRFYRGGSRGHRAASHQLRADG